MIFTIIAYLISLFFNLMTSTFNGVAYAMPTWIVQGEADALTGASHLQGILPMYPHSDMTGIASQTGIMPMFGFMLVILVAVIFSAAIWAGISFILRLLGRPNNSSVNEYIDAGGGNHYPNP